MPDRLDTFDKTTGIGAIRDRANFMPPKDDGQWSNKRVSIGSAIDRNLLQLNQYKLALTALGIRDLVDNAIEALGDNITSDDLAEAVRSQCEVRILPK